ncbi:unnamed protein product [Cochlearia groenlandica]
MEKESHEEMNNHITSGGDSMAKRKPGRPRKHTKLGSNSNEEKPLGSPPGFQQQQPLRHRDDNNEAMVGQTVSGVIEATFEAGFLLTVKIGSSDSILRGVVFKPGRCDLVSVDNDVAPNVPMIRRRNNSDNVFSSGRKSRFREKRGGGDARSSALVPVPIQPAHPKIPNNHMVPVVLQPNGGGTRVPVHHGPHMQTEAVSQASNGKLFETPHTGPSVEAESDEQALSIEPLQAIHPVHPVHVAKPMASYGHGNLTELLQAVQENVRETHYSQGQ